MGSVVGKKQDQRWRRYHTDHGGASVRHRSPAEPHPGNRHTPQSERQHLTLRTRLKLLGRQTIGFSRAVERHDIVIGLCVNRYKSGWAL
jgi:insertion element IS1 protein InsB